MVDFLSPTERSERMSRIRGKDTKPELALRKVLHGLRLRYRLHGAGLPGKPDLVFPRYKVVVFVHGCFWHRHGKCRFATTPATRADFWQAKFAANVTRDRAAMAELKESGWRVATIWECSLRKSVHVEAVAELVTAWLRSEIPSLEIGESDLQPNETN